MREVALAAGASASAGGAPVITLAVLAGLARAAVGVSAAFGRTLFVLRYARSVAAYQAKGSELSLSLTAVGDAIPVHAGVAASARSVAFAVLALAFFTALSIGATSGLTWHAVSALAFNAALALVAVVGCAVFANPRGFTHVVYTTLIRVTCGVAFSFLTGRADVACVYALAVRTNMARAAVFADCAVFAVLATAVRAAQAFRTAASRQAICAVLALAVFAALATGASCVGAGFAVLAHVIGTTKSFGAPVLRTRVADRGKRRFALAVYATLVVIAGTVALSVDTGRTPVACGLANPVNATIAAATRIVRATAVLALAFFTALALVAVPGDIARLFPYLGRL